MAEYPLSSGLAVSQSLQGILARKKAEARQQMLDQLNARNVESEMSARAENTRSMAEQRAAMADERQMKMLALAAKNWKMGQPMEGADPAVLALARKYNLLTKDNPVPQASVTTGVSAQAPEGAPMIPEGDKSISESLASPQTQAPTTPREYYVGSPEEQARERRKSAIGQMISGGMFSGGEQNIAKMLQIADAMEMDDLPASFFSSVLEPERPMYSVDPRKPGQALPLTDPKGAPITTRGNQPIVELLYPPSGPAPSFNYGGTVPSGIDAGKPIIIDSRTGAALVDGKPYTGPMGAKPTNVTKDIFPPGMSDKIASLHAKARPGFFGGVSPQAQAAIDAEINTALAFARNRVSDPSVIDVVRQILASDDQRSNAEILAGYAGQQGLSADEYEQFKTVLETVRQPLR